MRFPYRTAVASPLWRETRLRSRQRDLTVAAVMGSLTLDEIWRAPRALHLHHDGLWLASVFFLILVCVFVSVMCGGPQPLQTWCRDVASFRH